MFSEDTILIMNNRWIFNEFDKLNGDFGTKIHENCLCGCCGLASEANFMPHCLCAM